MHSSVAFLMDSSADHPRLPQQHRQGRPRRLGDPGAIAETRHSVVHRRPRRFCDRSSLPIVRELRGVTGSLRESPTFSARRPVACRSPRGSMWSALLRRMSRALRRRACSIRSSAIISRPSAPRPRASGRARGCPASSRKSFSASYGAAGSPAASRGFGATDAASIDSCPFPVIRSEKL